MRIAAVALLTALAAFTGCAEIGPGRPSDESGATRGVNDGGTSGGGRVFGLYARQCAACHGATGEADGPLAAWVYPPPRPFADGVFSLVSTENGIPTDADLATSIAHGLPGTGMPGFSWLSAADLVGLAHQVRELGIAGRVRFARLIAEHEGVAFDPAAARVKAVQQLAPGKVIDALPEPASPAQLLETGRALYLASCAACHGADGKCRPQTAVWRERFDVRLPRDFTAGVLRGGASREAIHRRIVAGMPAAGMPPVVLPDPQMQALVAYVCSLIPTSAAPQLPDEAAPLVAQRVATLPAQAGDAAWVTVRRRLWPLRADPDAVPFIELAAVHDGQEISVLVSWPDATRDSSPTASPTPDAVALQWSDAVEPPFLAMGSAGEAVHIWQWQAFAGRDSSGVTDVLESPLRHRTDAAPDALPRLRQRAVAMTARGRDMMPEFATAGRPIGVRQSWTEGRWQVVFRRPLAATVAGEIVFRGGATVQLAVAVWNGSAGQRGPNKAISGWLPLTLAH